MSSLLDFPTCFVCRSVELEIISNDELGLMSLCQECGYSWIATMDDIAPTIIKTIAS